ncbi:MAG TPA: lipid-A-disaccharide synthase [Burkholderiales bacterium]|nr:lipid-A-disaccharide synthase [Burkholderiales bacterium]
MAARADHVAIVAGESSGDQLAAHLMAALKSRRPALRFTGIGGPRMAAQGLEAGVPMEKLAVRGFTEALRHYREISRIRQTFGDRLLADPPGLFIGVDASEFNLGLERRLKDAGVPAVHYVSPSVWAWRRGRVHRVARSTTHLLAMFPFEPALYAKTGLPVTYVGHPLADLIPMDVDKIAARAALRLPSGRLVIALLPGSRRSELEHMAEAFVLAAHRLRQDVPEVHFVCPLATRETKDLFEATLHAHGRTDLPLTMLFGHSHEALAAADLALVASGTATLEAALFKTPMVITYRQSMLSWLIQRQLLYLPYVGMPNILAGERLVPELIQGRATPAALAGALLGLLRDTDAQERQVRKFREMHAALRQDNAARSAEAVLGVLDAGRA